MQRAFHAELAVLDFRSMSTRAANRELDRLSLRGITRRGFFARLGLVAFALPWLKLGETVARAERRRKNHRGSSNEIWIGHC